MVLFFVPILHIFYFTPGFVLMNVSYSSKMRLASEAGIRALRDEYSSKLASN
jgi:hypothetical protein